MSRVEIIGEYEDQLRIVGMILGQKLKHMRISCIALVIQIVSLTFAVVLLTGMYAVHSPGIAAEALSAGDTCPQHT